MRSKKEIMEIMDIFNQRDPNPRCELDYQNAYTLLVAVVLSAQATDKGVNKATKALFAVADTPQKMLALGIDKLKEYIKTIGLFNNKAKSIMALSKDLVDKYGGEVPHNREALESLAGGRTQNSQRRLKRLVRRTDAGRRHTCHAHFAPA